MRHREIECSGCGTSVGATTGGDAPTVRPHPGMLLVCVYCGTVTELDDQLVPQLVDEAKLTPEALARVTKMRENLRRIRPLLRTDH